MVRWLSVRLIVSVIVRPNVKCVLYTMPLYRTFLQISLTAVDAGIDFFREGGGIFDVTHRAGGREREGPKTPARADPLDDFRLVRCDFPRLSSSERTHSSRCMQRLGWGESS